jgi:hypothetical protein
LESKEGFIGSYDLVFSARKGVGDKKTGDIAEEIEKVIKTGKL